MEIVLDSMSGNVASELQIYRPFFCNKIYEHIDFRRRTFASMGYAQAVGNIPMAHTNPCVRQLQQHTNAIARDAVSDIDNNYIVISIVYTYILVMIVIIIFMY